MHNKGTKGFPRVTLGKPYFLLVFVLLFGLGQLGNDRPLHTVIGDLLHLNVHAQRGDPGFGAVFRDNGQLTEHQTAQGFVFFFLFLGNIQFQRLSILTPKSMETIVESTNFISPR